ncbi:hypothetical protein CRG98_015676 [Punica granatum]|uniref:Uncharacterized protein n=1 Tax=Punica granatum TaxID=22663 RepID=A0A2I0K5T0_PUNGR|nr:hypothetical protein CRG98_015676 [Punica granatum]
MARAFNAKVRPREFSPGDLVLRKVLHVAPDSRGKLSYKYDGPFVVKEIFFGGAVVLSDMDGIENAVPVNADAIKNLNDITWLTSFAGLSFLRAGAIGNLEGCSSPTDPWLSHAAGLSSVIGIRVHPGSNFPHSVPIHPSKAQAATGKATSEQSPGPKRGASYDIWLHPLTEHATKEGQAVSTPFWPTGFPHENLRPKPSDQRHVGAHFRGILHKPGHPDLSRTPFLTGLPRPAPLTSKRPPKTGLQAPRDHRGHGTSFRRPFGTLQGSPRDVSVVANASR